jgi:hypothetical protein
MYEGCSKRFAPHYFSHPLTKIEKCSFEGLKSDVSAAHLPSLFILIMTLVDKLSRKSVFCYFTPWRSTVAVLCRPMQAAG